MSSLTVWTGAWSKKGDESQGLEKWLEVTPVGVDTCPGGKDT